MEKTLSQKVETAIRLLRNAELAAQNKEHRLVEVRTPAWNTDGGGCKSLIDNNLVEIAYSGGKDSDVILHLARMAGIKHIAIHKRTTIDPPGTVQHAIDQGAVILDPETGFFGLMEKYGFPNQFARFCCEHLKEYKVLDTNVQGVRRSESIKRAKRYKEPVECRVYGRKDQRAECFYPILDWTQDDIREFVEQEHIQCHKLYYDRDGVFHPERRLGCLCCCLASRNKLIEQFKQHPGFVKAYAVHGKVYFDRQKTSKTNGTLFKNVYDRLLFHIFDRTYKEYFRKHHNSLFQEPSKQLLEDFFHIQLP